MDKKKVTKGQKKDPEGVGKARFQGAKKADGKAAPGGDLS